MNNAQDHGDNARAGNSTQRDPDPQPDAHADRQTFAAIDQIFADYALDAHVPGLVYGVLARGALAHAGTHGVQDLETKRPVTVDTLFRIASMTKVFTALTILKLRDDGRIRLDELAEAYVPEMRAWKYPTLDSARIRVRDLLNHSSGFVTDDPWGDRQQPLSDESFSQLLRDGVPFAHPPALDMEYSNLGYAVLGRIISNVSGRPFADEVTRTLLEPLRMTSSGFDADVAPVERRARGYVWQDHRWTVEPAMGHGAFGAMGGIHTTATDYVRWMSFLLSAWPPRDDSDTGPVRRATVRELAQGSNFPLLAAPRPAIDGEDKSRRAATYGMGLVVTVDPEFGLYLSHSGGYPGFGSYMLLHPGSGVGLFALANRTYAGPRNTVLDAMAVLRKAGFLQQPPVPVSDALAAAYRAAIAIYAAGDVAAGGDMLAMNLLLDRDAAGWARDLAELRKQVGACDTPQPLTARSALEGEFIWRCETGRIAGSILLAPTHPPRIQALTLTVK